MASPQRKREQQDFFDHSANNPAEADVIAMPVSEPTYPSDRQSKLPPLRIGEVLKRERERRGYDLQQIADYLCIRRSLLEAIEESQYDKFPADAYVIGFLRSYSDVIGINGQDSINHYRQEMAGRRKKPDLILPTPVSEGRAPTAVIMGAAALASLLIYILWYAFSTSDRTTVTTPPALPVTAQPAASSTSTASEPTLSAASGMETLSASAPSGIAISAPAPSSAPLPSTTPGTSPAVPESAPLAAAPKPAPVTAAPAHIMIKADQSSWVLISDSKGQTVFDRVLKPGETYNVPDTRGLSLTTGNGAGIILTLDGVDMPRLSNTTSHIVRNVPLETSALKALPQQPGQ